MVYNINRLSADLNHRNWRFPWKINFNTDPTRQTNDVIFTEKIQKQNTADSFRTISMSEIYRASLRFLPLFLRMFGKRS